MIHPHTEVRFIDEEIGHGVVATRSIPKGTVTWVRDRLDREFTSAEVTSFDDAHREVVERYSYRNATGHYVFCWDHTRFMNHSFDPTCLPTPFGLEIAIRDIEAGEELTNDYGTLNIIEPFKPRREEGSGGRDTVRPDDLLRYAPVWDAAIADAFSRFSEVAQPLAKWINASIRGELELIAKGERSLPSIGELLFSGETATGDGIAEPVRD
ncbi:MAG: SET domain-containing protein [Verrucomicrobiae bacterium]|nr:SET domain-containing protein [Verrucomicrobiae bacterium]